MTVGVSNKKETRNRKQRWWGGGQHWGGSSEAGKEVDKKESLHRTKKEGRRKEESPGRDGKRFGWGGERASDRCQSPHKKNKKTNNKCSGGILGGGKRKVVGDETIRPCLQKGDPPKDKARKK